MSIFITNGINKERRRSSTSRWRNTRLNIQYSKLLHTWHVYVYVHMYVYIWVYGWMYTYEPSHIRAFLTRILLYIYEITELYVNKCSRGGGRWQQYGYHYRSIGPTIYHRWDEGSSSWGIHMQSIHTITHYVCMFTIYLYEHNQI